MTTRTREQWEQDQAAELADQQHWLKSARSNADAKANAEMRWRIDPHGDIKQHEYLLDPLRRHCPPGATLNVLDVGSGFASYFPKAWLTRTIKITAIDPLAEHYPSDLVRPRITPPQAVRPGEAERLTEQFEAGSFDAVYCRNALEQTIDPLASLRQMLAVVKPDHPVLILQEGERSPEQRRRGPWTLSEDDEELILSGPEGSGERWDLRDELEDLVSDVRVTRSWHWPWLLAVLRRKAT
jgi:SAM-dependent methyltransferase